MLRRDYILSEIQKFHQVLAKILMLKQDGLEDDAKQMIEAEVTSLTGETLTNLIDSDIINIVKNKGLSIHKISAMAELLFQSAELTTDNIYAKSAYERSLKLYNYITEQEKTFSFERENKISLIHLKLKNY